MKKKIFCLFILMLLLTGCDLKFIKKNLNEEEKRINNEKIEYLEREFNGTTVTFVDRIQGTKNCECSFSFDGCIFEDCEKVEGKYIWRYKICSKKTPYYCTEAEYNDMLEEWSVLDEDNLNAAIDTINILNSNNSTYTPYFSDSNTRYFILIKQDDTVNNVIKEIVDKYPDIGYAYKRVKIVVFNEEDYNTIEAKTDKKTPISEPYELSRILLDELVFDDEIKKNDINDEMFNCNTDGYSHIFYELTFGDSDDDKTVLSCRGILNN